MKKSELQKLIKEEIDTQLNEAAGWEERHPNLTERGFGQTYSNLYMFLQDLKIFIEQSNVTGNSPAKLRLADSKLVEATEFAIKKGLVNNLKMMIAEMQSAVKNIK